MEAHEITKTYIDLFDEVIPLLPSIYKGFVSQKIELLKEARTKLRGIWKKHLPETEHIIGEREKTEAEKRFIIALPHL
ncbi:MAG TPA: hypothetical protein PK800_05820, partial [Syntrophorhabdaceae bacterium]|nr:hypothetical protein [Syntrophorhabdaceae bacterium]